MKRQHILYKGVVTVLLLLGAAPTMAQQDNSPAAMEKLKEHNLWFNTMNAAGTVYDNTRNFSNIIVNYDIEDGDFRRPQQGKKDKNLSVSSEGFMDLNKVYVWGKFSFKHENVTDAGYNASITDPFRGMPYYIVDEYLDSKWRNQFYDLQARVSSPVINNWLTLGLAGNYKASLAAKQRDPSVDTRFYTLRLVPSATFAFNEHHRAGVQIDYTSIKEDSRMDNVYYYLYQYYWATYGLGSSTQDYGSSGPSTNYIGDRIGAAVQYQYEAGPWNILLEGAYAKRVERAEQSYTTPRKMFEAKDQTIDVSGTILHEGEDFTHSLKAAWGYRHIDGIQFMNQRDNTESQQGWIDLHHDIRSTYVTRTASLKYGIMRNRDSEYNWRVDASVAYMGLKDKYILPPSAKDSKNLFIDLEAKKNFRVGDKLNNRLLVAVKGGLRNAMEGCYCYGGTHEEYPTITMEAADEAYLTSDAWHVGGSLTYSQQIKEDKKMHVFLKAAVDYHKSKADAFDKRTFASCTLGFNF